MHNISSCEWLTHNNPDSDEEYDYIPTERAAVRVMMGSLAFSSEICAKRAGSSGSRGARARKKQYVIISRRNSEIQVRKAERCVIDLTKDE